MDNKEKAGVENSLRNSQKESNILSHQTDTESEAGKLNKQDAALVDHLNVSDLLDSAEQQGGPDTFEGRKVLAKEVEAEKGVSAEKASELVQDNRDIGPSQKFMVSSEGVRGYLGVNGR